MKVADLRWVCPRGIGESDQLMFTLKDSITLPLLSYDDNETVTTFNKGGNVSGVPVACKIVSLDGRVSKVDGVLVKDNESNGIYLIPKHLVARQVSAINTKKETPIETLTKDTTKIVEGSLDEVKKLDTEKILGFTKKQLLVMALTVFVIIKIVK